MKLKQNLIACAGLILSLSATAGESRFEYSLRSANIITIEEFTDSDTDVRILETGPLLPLDTSFGPTNVWVDFRNSTINLGLTLVKDKNAGLSIPAGGHYLHEIALGQMPAGKYKIINNGKPAGILKIHKGQGRTLPPASHFLTSTEIRFNSLDELQKGIVILNVTGVSQCGYTVENIEVEKVSPGMFFFNFKNKMTTKVECLPSEQAFEKEVRVIGLQTGKNTFYTRGHRGTQSAVQKIGK